MVRGIALARARAAGGHARGPRAPAGVGRHVAIYMPGPDDAPVVGGFTGVLRALDADERAALRGGAPGDGDAPPDEPADGGDFGLIGAGPAWPAAPAAPGWSGSPAPATRPKGWSTC